MVTVSEAFPLPLIQTNLEKLSGSRIFSSLDAVSSFWQVPVDERSKKFLGFICHRGQFTWNAMPFGLKNASQTYSRLIQLVMDSMNSEHVTAYIDDVLIHTLTLRDHFHWLEEALKRHRNAGIMLNPKKTKLFETEVDYLGHRVSEDGIKMKTEYLAKIRDWPTPRTTKELNQFLGLISYYKEFIRDFGILTNEMNTQRRKKTLEWTDTMEKKFMELKSRFMEAPLRSYPKYSGNVEPFKVTTDWSADGRGAVLSQSGRLRERARWLYEREGDVRRLL